LVEGKRYTMANATLRERLASATRGNRQSEIIVISWFTEIINVLTPLSIAI
jgi:hypothetical protein